MKKTLEISAIINTYNEENNIEKCLNNIKWVDEIILVDMGSSDNTINYAKKYTKNIYIIDKKTHVEVGRNYAIDKARGKWILVLDSDETLTANAEYIINKLVKNTEINGYWFPRKQFINSNTYLKYGYFYPDYQLRLFRNQKDIRYSGDIHIPPSINKQKTKIVSDLKINHNPSHSKYSSLLAFRRFFPYIKIEGEMLSRTNISNIRLLEDGFIEIIRHFFRSFIKLSGYKDGYYGFRAALIFTLYKSAICYYAFIKRLRF